MTHRRERLGDAGGVARLEMDVDGRLEVVARLDEPARRRDGGPDVEPAIDDRTHELGVDLRLGVAAHRAGHDPRTGLAVPEQHPGEQRVERPLARREHVRVRRIEAEVAAAVVVVDAGHRVDHARAEAHVVRLDEADRVALRVDRREVDRAAAPRSGRRRADRLARRGSIRGGERVDPRRIEQRLDLTGSRVGSVRVASRSAIAQLGRLDAEVDPGGVGDPVRPEGARRRRLEPLEDRQQLRAR